MHPPGTPRGAPRFTLLHRNRSAGQAVLLRRHAARPRYCPPTVPGADDPSCPAHLAADQRLTAPNGRADQPAHQAPWHWFASSTSDAALGPHRTARAHPPALGPHVHPTAPHSPRPAPRPQHHLPAPPPSTPSTVSEHRLRTPPPSSASEHPEHGLGAPPRSTASEHRLRTPPPSTASQHGARTLARIPRLSNAAARTPRPRRDRSASGRSRDESATAGAPVTSRLPIRDSVRAGLHEGIACGRPRPSRPGLNTGSVEPRHRAGRSRRHVAGGAHASRRSAPLLRLSARPHAATRKPGRRGICRTPGPPLPAAPPGDRRLRPGRLSFRLPDVIAGRAVVEPIRTTPIPACAEAVDAEWWRPPSTASACRAVRTVVAPGPRQRDPIEQCVRRPARRFCHDGRRTGADERRRPSGRPRLVTLPDRSKDPDRPCSSPGRPPPDPPHWRFKSTSYLVCL